MRSVWAVKDQILETASGNLSLRGLIKVRKQSEGKDETGVLTPIGKLIKTLALPLRHCIVA